MAIYVLALEGGRYYVGETDNVVNSFQAHLDGSRCSWTRKYKPLRIEEVTRFGDQDAFVKRYMWLYGMNYVRGGSYQDETISPEQEKELLEEICKYDSLYPRSIVEVPINGVRNVVSGVLGAVSDVFGAVRDIVKPDVETTQRNYFRN